MLRGDSWNDEEKDWANPDDGRPDTPEVWLCTRCGEDCDTDYCQYCGLDQDIRPDWDGPQFDTREEAEGLR